MHDKKTNISTLPDIFSPKYVVLQIAKHSLTNIYFLVDP